MKARDLSGNDRGRRCDVTTEGSPVTTKPQPALIEIVERNGPEYDPERPGTGVIRPNEVRINGTPLLVPRDETITVHEVEVGADALLKVTLTVFARRVSMGPET